MALPDIVCTIYAPILRASSYALPARAVGMRRCFQAAPWGCGKLGCCHRCAKQISGHRGPRLFVQADWLFDCKLRFSRVFRSRGSM